MQNAWIQIHGAFGVAVLVCAFLILIWNAVRIGRGRTGRSFRPVMTGMVDLEILLGIVAFIARPVWGLFLLHPITMLAAAAVVHTMTKESRRGSVQIAGYALAAALLVLGVEFARAF